VFEAHEQFLDDPELVEGHRGGHRESGTPAEHAVSDRFAAAIEQFEALDGKMAERADDLRDVRDRLLRIFLNTDAATDLGDLPAGTVVLAPRLTPSDTAELDPDGVAGIATVAGGRTAHAAIIARSLSIPAVVGVGESLREIEDGTELLVDGTDGRVVVDPDAAAREGADADAAAAVPSASRPPTADRLKWRRTSEARRRSLRPPSAAPTGSGCSGRSSSLRPRDPPPTEAEQYEAVTAALSAFPDGRVVVRTLDVGGDKQVPYLDLPDESNPFLGRRGSGSRLTSTATCSRRSSGRCCARPTSTARGSR